MMMKPWNHVLECCPCRWPCMYMLCICTHVVRVFFTLACWFRERPPLYWTELILHCVYVMHHDTYHRSQLLLHYSPAGLSPVSLSLSLSLYLSLSFSLVIPGDRSVWCCSKITLPLNVISWCPSPTGPPYPLPPTPHHIRCPLSGQGPRQMSLSGFRSCPDLSGSQEVSCHSPAHLTAVGVMDEPSDGTAAVLHYVRSTDEKWWTTHLVTCHLSPHFYIWHCPLSCAQLDSDSHTHTHTHTNN